MENQHRKITGYRELSEDEISLMNRIKEKGNELGELIAELQAKQKKEVEFVVTSGDEELTAKAESVIEARRWTEIAKTNIQQGLMALTRAVARPDFF